MRWLLAHPGPGFSVHDVYAGWREALDGLGEQTFEFNLDDRLAFYDSAYLIYDETQGVFRKACTPEQAIELAMNGLAAALFKLRPQVLLVVSGFFSDTDVFDQARASGTRVVLLCTESPYEDDRQLLLAEHVDLCLLNDPTNIDRFRQITRAEYIPHAYRPTLHHPDSTPSDLDLVFVGTGYPSRIEFFEAMDLDGLAVQLGGNWMRLADTDSPLRKHLGHDLDDCLDNEDTAELYRRGRVGLNLYRREAAHPELEGGWAMGPREVEMAACELFFLRDPRGEGDDLLPMLPTFQGPQDAAEKLRWWLAHPTERGMVARAARARVTGRTFTANATRLLELLGKERGR